MKATQERLVLALQAAEGGVWDFDLARNEAWWSPEMYRLWNVSPGEEIRLEHALALIDARDRRRVLSTVRDAVERRGLYECEFRLMNHGGQERWMASRGRVHCDAMGEATRMIGITIDITTRKDAEIRLRRSNDALVRSNVELQRFAHIAAHDLQTPLRSIGNFGELLKSNYDGRLDQRGRGWLDRMLESACQLHALIRDLLEYSSIDAEPLSAQQVNLEDIVERAQLLLDAEIRDSGCRITRGALPVIKGEFTQLVQVLLNLIGNAIKYRSDRAPAIHISAEQLDAVWKISVRDNGIGIDARHATRIFEVFERLHTAQEYPGTGVGLALCRRVVQRHGGLIWVESEPGIGSNFVFTLPVDV